jgi:hypothetical protein
LWFAWWEYDRCGDYSNTVQVRNQITPATPNLNLSTETAHVNLTWDNVDYAESYQIEVYTQYNWQPLATVGNNSYRTAYRSNWDLAQIEFRVKACRDGSRCSGYSDTVKLWDQLPVEKPSRTIIISNSTDEHEAIELSGGTFQFDDGTGYAEVEPLTKYIETKYIDGYWQQGNNLGH